MRLAIRGGDEWSLREILAPFPTDTTESIRDPRLQLSDAQAGIILAGKRIADAIARRFVESGNRLASGAGVLSPDVLESALANIAETQFHRVSDDLSTLPQPGDPQARILFRRVARFGDGRELWHVDLSGNVANATTAPSTAASAAPSTVPSDPDADDLLNRAAFMRRLAIALNDVAEEIEQGRRRTLDDARAAIVDRFHSTIARSIHPPTQPTTSSSRH